MSLKNLAVGHEVRRAGAPHDSKNIGVIVEADYCPFPSVSGVDSTDPTACEKYARDLDIAKSTPAQLKVYWRTTKQVEGLLETEVDGNYPGGNSYRAWDRAFPLFAVETGGYGDILVYTPDGEEAVFDMEPVEASDDSYEAWRAHVLRAVGAYLDTQRPKDGQDEEPYETALVENFENAEFEAAG